MFEGGRICFGEKLHDANDMSVQNLLKHNIIHHLYS